MKISGWLLKIKSLHTKEHGNWSEKNIEKFEIFFGSLTTYGHKDKEKCKKSFIIVVAAAAAAAAVLVRFW